MHGTGTLKTSEISLVELDPKNSNAYVFLSDVFAKKAK